MANLCSLSFQKIDRPRQSRRKVGVSVSRLPAALAFAIYCSQPRDCRLCQHQGSNHPQAGDDKQSNHNIDGHWRFPSKIDLSARCGHIVRGVGGPICAPTVSGSRYALTLSARTANVAQLRTDHGQVGCNETGHRDVECHRTSPFAGAAAGDGLIIGIAKVDAA